MTILNISITAVELSCSAAKNQFIPVILDKFLS